MCTPLDTYDHRSWTRREAVFATHIEVATVLPDEGDVAEFGVRVAVAFVQQRLALIPSTPTYRYRRP